LFKKGHYKHGPLARIELGKNTVQGIGYAYTIQGRLKAVNGTGLTPANDIGKDALAGGPTSTFAKDVAAFSLDYFTGDFKPIGGATFDAVGLKYTNNTADITGQNLYNGNIGYTTMALSQFNSGSPVGYSYRYDELNRLLRMSQHKPVAGAQTFWKERHLYSSRLGMFIPEIQLTGTSGDAKVVWNQSNRIRYELTNHLGNVLATISDQPLPSII
jgi:hypothetical protein